MKFYIIKTLEVYLLTIVISMAVAGMIILLNKVLFFFEDLHSKKNSSTSDNSNGKS